MAFIACLFSDLAQCSELQVSSWESSHVQPMPFFILAVAETRSVFLLKDIATGPAPPQTYADRVE